MHTALDFIEEKLSSTQGKTNDVRELYLGQLYAAEDYKLYPFFYLLPHQWAIIYFLTENWVRNNEQELGNHERLVMISTAYTNVSL